MRPPNPNSQDLDTIGGRMRAVREMRQFSQQKMADMLSLSKRQYCRYEYGNAKPSFAFLTRMAEIAEANVDWLLSRSGSALQAKSNLRDKSGSRIVVSVVEVVLDGQVYFLEVRPSEEGIFLQCRNGGKIITEWIQGGLSVKVAPDTDSE